MVSEAPQQPGPAGHSVLAGASGLWTEPAGSGELYEHYGLLRQQDENGRYERTSPEHSGNSSYVMTN